ncbi:hypothetical protein BDA99DRAFT_296466 [Phascolomyces articulosus]|uniref:Uncharacterized protein n=1 Tax=Phascolomyces articulosus TaxID=60185 RepID=A0AAD5P759_9FUNG|nr:hypothetical protein BDA99DRAFT_296466 [Phascolomyces articulosus]
MPIIWFVQYSFSFLFFPFFHTHSNLTSFFFYQSYPLTFPLYINVPSLFTHCIIPLFGCIITSTILICIGK